MAENQNGKSKWIKTEPENENGFNIHMRTQPRNDDEMILKITKESMMIVKLLILKTTNQLSYIKSKNISSKALMNINRTLAMD